MHDEPFDRLRATLARAAPRNRIALAARFVIDEADQHDSYRFASDLRDRAFVTGVLTWIGVHPPAAAAAAAIARVRQLVDWLLLDVSPLRSRWLLAAMAAWPAELAAQTWRPWILYLHAFDREIVDPTPISAAQLAAALASIEPVEVARALVIAAGLPPQRADVVIAPLGAEVLDRAGADDWVTVIAFVRVVTRYRHFVPRLGRVARIALAIDALVRTAEPFVGAYVAAWLLEQGDAPDAVDTALAHLAAVAPGADRFVPAVGLRLIDQLWTVRGRARRPVRAVLVRHLSGRSTRRSAGDPLRALHEHVSELAVVQSA